ncbi:hypothetical protein ABZ726_19480 [Streptomyces hundungensis]|uniref:hypothetical protein n=1 Tax=Streptomyces hundungensis TaxID=1077946 RepID=UPI0033CC860E
MAHRNGRELERKVDVSGFSQGGPATMLVGRALQQEGADRYFRLGALAPVSGPYNLSVFEAAAANDEINNSGLYLAYFATAWNRMYGLYASPDDAFASRYAGDVEGLFDGCHTPKDITKVLPTTSKALFKEDFLNKVRKPDSVLKDRLRGEGQLTRHQRRLVELRGGRGRVVRAKGGGRGVRQARCQSAGTFGGSHPVMAVWAWRQR